MVERDYAFEKRIVGIMQQMAFKSCLEAKEGFEKALNKTFEKVPTSSEDFIELENGYCLLLGNFERPHFPPEFRPELVQITGDLMYRRIYIIDWLPQRII